MNTKINQFDQYYMAQALRLAEKGLWSTDPNPRVGCVIVRNGEIVGEGWHQKTGESHAEVFALEMAKERAEGATCYVTLEPCCHHGHTPPCTDALVKAKVARVVVAMTDPNPIVSTKGIEQLQKAGIVVDTGVLGQQAEQLNPGFSMRMRHNRPYIRCKLAMSLDGRTAMQSGESKWITSQDSRRDVQILRARSSAVMTGAGTILADNPLMTVREDELPDYLPKPIKIKQPLRVIVDANLSVTSESRLLNSPGETVIFTASRNESLKTMLREETGAHVIYLPDGERRMVDLPAMCECLARDYQVNEVLLETGAILSGSMLRAGLCDELIFYVAPLLMGHKARGLFNLPDIECLGEAIPLKIEDVRSIGCDLRITVRPVRQRNFNHSKQPVV